MTIKNDGEPKRKTMPNWMNFVIGGVSGMAGITIVQPMDLLKTRCQLLGPKSKQSFITVAQNIVKNEGVLGFYTGLSAALFRQATYTTTRLGCFNTLMDYYKAQTGTVPNFASKVGIGLIAGATGAFVGTPAEVALIRMTADGRLPQEQRRNYKHIFDALSRIVREEGVLTLWSGAGATVSRAIVVNGAQLGSYAQARQMLLPYLSDGLPLHFCSAMISGFVTTVASLPLDIVKTRVQNAPKGASQITVFMNVIKNEGVLSLWSGLWPTYGKLGPHTVLVFIFMEQLNNLYFKMA